MIDACTIIAGNYLAGARVLVDSFFAHHPGGTFTVLVVDDEDRRLTLDDGRVDGRVDRRVNWRRLGDIGLDAAEIHRLAGIYDVTELCTAVKPRLLRQLLEEGRTEVIYLDPDICLYDSIAEVAGLASRHGIVLTPHTTAPFPDDGRQVDSLFVLAAGVYNLGFIAVGSSSFPFLDWWWRQTRRHALNEVTRMLFTDQRWVDYVPSLFDPFILKDPGYNVAYWNLHARKVMVAGRRYVVAAAAADAAAPADAATVPLRFFHFSGFDPRKPWLLSRHQGDQPRVLLSEHPTLARLCRDYADRLVEAGRDAGPEPVYGWQTAAAGLEMTGRVRRLYWGGVTNAEQGREPEPPDPFDRHNPDRFVAWLNTPGPYGPRSCSRFLYEIYRARAEVQVAFPDIGGGDAERFAEWVWRYGVEQDAIPVTLLPAREGDRATPAPPAPVPARTAPLAPGLNVAGYFRSAVGVGEAGRLVLRAVEASGIPCATRTQRPSLTRQDHPFEERGSSAAAFDINLLCVNADETLTFAREAGEDFFAGRHTIGYWFWEVAPLPLWMHAAFTRVDEVWAATDYVAGILRAAGKKPVFTVPLPLLPPEVPADLPAAAPALVRERLGLPDRFTFLLLFDFLSVADRKNPLGLIEAFTSAFAPDEGPVLVLKSLNGHLRVPQLERLRTAIAHRPDILSLESSYTLDEKNSLVAACDCYVSLHRAEGLGLTMAEAMALGKPTIATGFSGNLHFMTRENSYLVDYTLSTVPAGCEPYAVGSRWADPDLAHAARLMREVYENPEAAARKGAIARADLLERHGVAASAVAVARRVEEIRQARAAAGAEPVMDAAVGTAVDEATVDVARDAARDVAMDAAAAEPTVPAGLPGSLSLEEPGEARLTPVRESSSTAVAALEALLPQLHLLGQPRLSEDDRRWSTLRRMAQRLLFRVMQPYWFQQRQFQEALIGALQSSVERLAADAQARQAEERTRLEALDGAITQSRGVIAEGRDAIAQGRDETRAELATLRDRLATLSFALEGRHLVQRADDGDGETRIGDGRPFGANGHARVHDGNGHQDNGHQGDSHQRDSHQHGSHPGNGREGNGREGTGHRHHAHGAGDNGHGERRGDRATSEAEPLFHTRRRLYLPLLTHRTPVLDIGCGYGRMLDLLRVANLPSFGIDPDPRMVSHCRANGHLVEQADALAFLRQRSSLAGSIGAIFSSRLHADLPLEPFQDLLHLCRRHLDPGGLLIAETPLSGSADDLHPEALLVLCRRAGFEEAHVLFHAATDSHTDAAPNARAPQRRYAVVATARGR